MKRFVLLNIMIYFLIGCATQALQAPCGDDGVGCGKRISLSRDERA